MATDSLDRVAVRLTLTKDISLNCYPPVKEFIAFMLEHISGEAQGTFGDVVLSAQTPSPDDVYKLWIATNGQRNGFEQRLFLNGAWRTWNFVAEGEIRHFDGRATLPKGWTKIGSFKTVDVPITAEAGDNVASLPETIQVAKWVGY